MSGGQGPVWIDLPEESEAPDPGAAPPLPDMTAPPAQGAAMRRAAGLAARRPSWLGRAMRAVLGALIGVAVTVAAYDFAARMVERLPWLGYAVAALMAALVLLLAVLSLRELAALARLRRLDALNRTVRDLRDGEGGGLAAAGAVTDRLSRLYAPRADMEWALARLDDLRADQRDAPALLDLAEAELMAPLDAAARAEIERAARQVAAATALVPLALADVAAALAINLGMIRRIAGIYGGRGGVLGGWRLTRAVMAHLVATGAVAVGEDVIGSVAGGGVVSRISRRFGEGVVNGALTARVGIAAIELCRPMPFSRLSRPSVAGLVKRALAGLFTNG